MNIRRLALDSILLGLATAFSFLESLIPAPAGMRLGLSSILVMYAILFLTPADAAALVLLKSVFVLFTRGISAGILSFSGGFLSFLGMYLLFQIGASLLLTSAIGGLLHNLGQILAAMFLLDTPAVFSYFPFIAFCGLFAGMISACIFRFLIPYLVKYENRTQIYHLKGF